MIRRESVVAYRGQRVEYRCLCLSLKAVVVIRGLMEVRRDREREPDYRRGSVRVRDLDGLQSRPPLRKSYMELHDSYLALTLRYSIYACGLK